MPKIVDADARRADIAEAVFRIIAVDGLERASLREVADEAGLAVGSVRHYFPGSEDLLRHAFATVVDRVTGRLTAALPALHGSERGTAGQRSAVLALLSQVLPLDDERAVDACVWMAFRHAARVRPFLDAEADRSYREVAAVVGQVITAAVPDNGDGRRQALAVEAERLLATLDGLCMHALLQPAWMTAQVCHEVLDRHLRTLGA